MLALSPGCPLIFPTRALKGNSRDKSYLPDLERVKGMAALAMGQISDKQTKSLLETLAKNHTGQVLEEILFAVQSIREKIRP